jgi:site-specific DNA recombinase
MEEVRQTPVSDAALKRAVIYIRVSTKQQAVRDGNPEGYSLPTQREACRKKAESLDAVVVDEYIDKDSATSANKRPGFQQLVERVVQKRDVDYVIVFKLDRFARNRLDDALVSMRLETPGASLVSCVEHIDATASGQLLQGMLAVMNEFYSRNLGDEIKRKTLQKVLAGGTPGVARLGYKNVGESGRRYVVVDPEPAALIQWCFEAYATGEWSVQSLLGEATKRGLRSRGGPNTPQKELSISQLHRILASPYYKGIVIYNGVEYAGKHEKLVDEETWQRVQDMLTSKARGEKQRVHHHYLKGTIWCGHCGSRLCVSYSKGKLGTIYPYYFCVGRQQRRTTCMLKYRPIDLVEQQIIDHYRFVQLKTDGLEATGVAVIQEAAANLASAKAERARQRKRAQQLEAERTKLLHAHYAGAVPLDLLQQEQARISGELGSLELASSQVSGQMERIQRHVEQAVAWATDCHRAYTESPARGRRLMNRAFFNRVWVTERGVVGWQYNEPFNTLMTRHGKPADLVIVAESPSNDGIEEPSGSYERQSPGRLTRAFSLLSSKQPHLAEGVGFEPTVPGGTHALQASVDVAAGERPNWRREWDLNPRCPEAHTLSRRADSAALASLRA